MTYEPQPLGTKRGPDFAVAHDAGTTVMFEVTRMRARAGESSGSPGTTAGGEPFGPLEGRRFVDTVCGKMGQLQPQRPNLLLVGTATQLPAASDLEAAMARIRRLAEACDPTVVQRHGFRGRGDFFRHFGRLSAVVVRTLPLVEGAAPVLWLNPLAKQALPRKVRAAIDRSHSR